MIEGLPFGLNRLIFLVLLSVAVSAAAARVLSRMALRIGLADQPGGRKQHEGVIPVTGGLAMYFGFAAAALASELVYGPTVALVAALALVVVGGAADDMHDITPRAKFFIQVGAALLMTSWAGVFVTQLGDLLGFGPTQLYNWAIPFSVICALGVINAMNMVDGIDGAAGSTALVAALWFALGAWLEGLREQSVLLLFLAGAIAGFLAWNMRFPGRSQARVFMGDCGSMMLGLALCWFAIDVTQGEGRTMPPIAGVWILAVPLLDMGRVMFVRVFRRVDPFDADREHLHHYLTDRGVSVFNTSLVLAAASVLGGAVGIGGWRLGVPDWVMFYFFAALAVVLVAAAYRHAKKTKAMAETQPASTLFRPKG
jgi:UDP-GlcNAc:undecaprenyl-phosphate GlcNAc-1-phosphate transferase